MTSSSGSYWNDDGVSFFDCSFPEGFDCDGPDLYLSLELLVDAVWLVLLLPVVCTVGGADPSLGLLQEVRLF
jgi:hypothetical protein